MFRVSRAASLGALLLALWIGSASAKTILSLPITTAVSSTGSVFQYRARNIPRAATIQMNFTYGSGGTSTDAYVQTSLDGGSTWCDVAHYALTTASARKFNNFSSLTPVTTNTGVACTDGAMTTTYQDGLIGDRWRVKYVTVGTYGGGTTLAIDIQSDELISFP